jgi:hypothetical protein
MCLKNKQSNWGVSIMDSNLACKPCKFKDGMTISLTLVGVGVRESPSSEGKKCTSSFQTSSIPTLLSIQENVHLSNAIACGASLVSYSKYCN